jgi:hypothetical protein
MSTAKQDFGAIETAAYGSRTAARERDTPWARRIKAVSMIPGVVRNPVIAVNGVELWFPVS